MLQNNGPYMWPEGASVPVLPLPFKVQSGRPKKLRKRDVDEAHHIPETDTTKLK